MIEDLMETSPPQWHEFLFNLTQVTHMHTLFVAMNTCQMKISIKHLIVIDRQYEQSQGIIMLGTDLGLFFIGKKNIACLSTILGVH